MGIVVPFQDIVRARRRQRDHAYAARCIEVIEGTLRLALDRFGTAPPAERPLYARRVRQLSELLEYAVHTL